MAAIGTCPDVTLNGTCPGVTLSLSKGDLEQITAHYALVTPIMEQLFGHIPIVWTTFLNDPDETRKFHQQCFGHYSHLSAEHAQHLVSIGAREFYSWFPIVDDPSRARFARFILCHPEESKDREPIERLKHAAQILRAVIEEEAGETIPVLDGAGNIALFLPLDDAPPYPDLRLRCHTIARKAIALHPDLLSESVNTHNDGRVHIHVSSNAEGRFSILPYSLRFTTGNIAIPISWFELSTIPITGVSLTDFPSRLSTAGELFHVMVSPSNHDPATQPSRVMVSPSNHPEPVEGQTPNAKRTWNNAKGALLSAVVAILSDGKPRTADEILAAGLAARTIDPKTNSRAIYIDLTQNIAREKGRGHKPPIIEDPDRRFRINEPLDAWPAVPTPPLPTPSPQTQALIDRLRTTAHAAQTDGSAFELAVCDAFAALGYLSTHLGGVGNPDGYIDAPLGVLGYRSMLECKSGVDIQKDQMVFEAAKFREPYNAKYCAIIGPDFGQRYDIVEELQTHDVSAWSVESLIMALTMQATPYELRSLFEPGFAEDKVNDILWSRNHSEPKRVRIVADIIHHVGWLTQTAAAQANTPGDAPLLTEDAAMLLVDQDLAAQGAHVNCTREEVRLAFEWLSSPLVGAAMWNEQKDAIVIISAP